TFTSDQRVFTDLLAYAPGMNTSWADVLAVLEAEAGSKQIATGSIDPAARKLIDKARSAGWRVLTTDAGTRGLTPPAPLVFDGAGRYGYEQTYPTGLEERIVCDGKTVLHLYPDLGLGARRAMSRFHRAEFASVVPWVLPPVEDLGRAGDLKCIDEHTV